VDDQSANSKALVARMIEALNDRVIEGQEAYWHRDMHWYGPAGIGTKPSLETFQNEHQRPFLHAFPDKKAVDEIRIAEGSYVASSGYVEATHLGEWLGIPPTGRRVRVRYMDFWRVEGDKLKENWVLIDILDFMQQVGIDPFELIRKKLAEVAEGRG